MTPPPPAVLILAGRRAGRPDPLAAAAGVSHKALVPVAGRAMLARVLDVAAAALPDAIIHVSSDEVAALARDPAIADHAAAARIRWVAAGPSLADSVHAGAAAAGLPLVVTTADAVMLTGEAIAAMVAAGAAADALVTLVPAASARAAHPAVRPTAYRFRDGAYVNCNLYWAGSARALGAAEAFRHGGQFLKVPFRILRIFGLANLWRFHRRRYGLDDGFGFIGRRLGVDVRPLVLDDGRLAIDVDDARSLAVAQDLIEGRGR